MFILHFLKLNKRLNKILLSLLCRVPDPLILAETLRNLLTVNRCIYDEPSNVSLCSKIKSVQYNELLALTSAIKVRPGKLRNFL